jgi:uncharacterized protein (DUF58 family)
MFDWLRHPRRTWKAWWSARLAPLERTTLTQRNIYIVPTRAGLAFGATVLVLLVASLNYQLSLGFALTFLLAGSALASMHMTHGSLRDLSLHVKPPADVFAGDSGLLEIVVTNPGATRHGIGVGLDTGVRPIPLAYDEIAAQGQTVLHLAWPVATRGVHFLPVVRAESRFPFGLFKAWTLWRPAGRIVAYPRPEQPAPPWPESAAEPGAEQTMRHLGGGEFDGVRAYRRGDSVRQVVWKKAARTGELVSRETQQARQRSLWLAWSQAVGADPERRLERLCAWVLLAEQAGFSYGLRLPGVELPPDHGPQQRQAALQALADWS